MNRKSALSHLPADLHPRHAFGILRVTLGGLSPSVMKVAAIRMLDGATDFVEARASRSKHHAFPGGLVLHTLEVVLMAKSADPGNEELIIAAAMHDLMKIREQDDGDGYRNMIGHVTGSAIMFSSAVVAQKPLLTDEEWKRMDEITHAMLSHHGRPEWGSPVIPVTRTAMLLHSIDMISSRFPYFTGVKTGPWAPQEPAPAAASPTRAPGNRSASAPVPPPGMPSMDTTPAEALDPYWNIRAALRNGRRLLALCAVNPDAPDAMRSYLWFHVKDAHPDMKFGLHPSRYRLALRIPNDRPVRNLETV